MTFSIRNLKIREQLLLLTLPPLFVLLSSVSLFFYAYWLATHSSRSIQRAEESIAHEETLLRHVTEVYLAVRGYLFLKQTSFLHNYDVATQSASAELAILGDLQSGYPDQTARFNLIRSNLNAFETAWATPALDATRNGEKLELGPTVKDGERRLVEIRASLNALVREDRQSRVSDVRSAELVMRRALYLGVGMAILFGVVLLFLTRFVTRAIEQPVRQLIEASVRVGRGDFAPALPPVVNNEFGILSRSFSNMTQALRREREELAALKRFTEAVNQCTSENEVYDHILHSLQERFQPQQVIIFKLRAEEDFLEAVATLAPLPAALREWPVMEGKHSCKAVRMGRPFRLNDVTLEPLCPGRFALPQEGSYYCGPLIAGGIIIGAVRLESAKDFWTPERESLLESYLSGAATALSNLRLLQTMRQQANIDPLTGLYNRRFLEEYAGKLMAMARRKESPLGFLMMDLDHFKSFNDIYGHEIGDRILKQFSKTVTQTMRETNLTARFGGEEFVVLLPDTGSKACEVVAERIRKAVGRMTVASGSDKPLPQITVSVGVAVYPDHGAELEEILQASDKALYESKRAGRNRTTIYVEETETTG
jgi:diguanylate cyclase (GGDEF)-like protein